MEKVVVQFSLLWTLGWGGAGREAALLALKVEEGAITQGMWADFRNWKGP